MPIGFARLEFVKRSSGKNACQKSAYAGNLSMKEHSLRKNYYYLNRKSCLFHETMLPKGTDQKFLKPEILWNEVEKTETRKNSQVAMEMVLALPDDIEVSLDDKIELSRRFARKYFVDKGLAAQINIHFPSSENKEKNWHAHFLFTTRRFDETGKKFGQKARDLCPNIKKGSVMFGNNWGQIWTQLQNEYFHEKGIDLFVDPTGIVAQKHIGPHRLHANLQDVLNENISIKKKNAKLLAEASLLLNKITEKQSVFSSRDLNNYLRKFVPLEFRQQVKDSFWRHPSLLQLYDQDSGKALQKFTTKDIVKEEERIIRYAQTISNQKAFHVKTKIEEKINESLNIEQKVALKNVIEGSRLSLIQGSAGTGKSYLLKALNEGYKESKKNVRGLAPTNEVARDMEKNGFVKPSTLHSFLYKIEKSKMKVSSKEIWIIDEASMIENRVLQEIFRLGSKHKAQIVLVGDKNQLPPIGRGGLFSVLCEKFGCSKLEQIQRQEEEWGKDIADNLSKGFTSKAIDLLHRQKAIFWNDTKEQAISAVIKKWSIDKKINPNQTQFILEHRNQYSKIINDLIHEVRKNNNEISSEEFECETFLGRSKISIGDRIQFRQNDSKKDITNGTLGKIVEASKENFTIKIDGENKKISFDPRKFSGYQLGYAGTYHKSQGKTVDRSYVMHSPWTNRNLFYVGLTRHKKEVSYFVSKDEVPYLSALKYQALRKGAKESIQSYNLSNESSVEQTFFHKFYKNLKEKIGDTFHKDRDFYKYKAQKRKASYEVREIKNIPREETIFSNKWIQIQSHLTTNSKEKINTLEAIDDSNNSKGFSVKSFIKDYKQKEHLEILKGKYSNSEKTESDLFLMIKEVMTKKNEITEYLKENNFKETILNQSIDQCITFYLKNERLPSKSELTNLKEIYRDTKDLSGIVESLFGNSFSKEDKKNISDFFREQTINKTLERNYNFDKDTNAMDAKQVAKEITIIADNIKQKNFEAEKEININTGKTIEK